jgi:nicotinamidase-related amidase
MSTLTTPALIVVDLQALTLGNAKTMPADDLLANVATLIAAFREANHPVIFAVSTGTPAGCTSYSETGRTWPAELTEIPAAVAPLDGETVVRRAAWSAFAGTNLSALLTESGVTTTVIVGLATPFGIESTARDAYDAGFTVIVPTDAIAAPDDAAHEWTISRVIPMLGTTTVIAGLVDALGSSK